MILIRSFNPKTQCIEEAGFTHSVRGFFEMMGFKLSKEHEELIKKSKYLYLYSPDRMHKTGIFHWNKEEFIQELKEKYDIRKIKES